MGLSDELLKQSFEFYENLDEKNKVLLREGIQTKTFSKGEIIYNSDAIWKGLKKIYKGRIRVFLSTEQGNTVTLYRVRKGEVCMISLLCLLDQNFKTSVGMEVEEDSEIFNISPDIYEQLMKDNDQVREMNDNLSQKIFSEIMYVISDLMFSNVEKRLAKILLYHCETKGDSVLNLTHELLANDIGSAREVVSRNLKRFQNLGYLEVNRGKIKILDAKSLKELSEA